MEENVEQSQAHSKLKSLKTSDHSLFQDAPITPVAPLTKGTASMIWHKLKSSRVPISIGQWFFWGAVFTVTATVSATIGATLALMTPLSPLISQHSPTKQKEDWWRHDFQYRLARPVNILVMGIDRVLDAPDNSEAVFQGHSDTMLLLRVDPRDRAVKMLSIPRDTRVESPSLSIKKINQANADGGAQLAAKVVSNTFNNVAVDRYVRITTGAFRELVDLVGGIEVFVPEPMSYVDNTQNLKIDLQQGWQTLNGEQAEQFARYRRENGDIARIQRQQVLLKALRQRLQTPTVLTRVPQLIRVMQKYVDTNLSLEEMLALASFALKLEPDDFKMVLLPGRFSKPSEYSASYWIMDSAAKDRIMSEYFDQRLPVNVATEVNRTPTKLRIAIQNASGEPQLTQRLAQELREKGFESVYTINPWPDLQRETQIIVNKGDTKAAIALKRAIGLGKVEAISTGDLGSDLTIRLGQDWTNRQ